MLQANNLPASDWLPLARGKLFQCLPGFKATIEGIIVVNQSATAQNAKLYVNTDLTPDNSRPISPFPLTMASGDMSVWDSPMRLTANQYIEGEADAESVVSWVIWGYTERV